MPLKVIRRPYQDCAYRWALSTSGISTGEGDCSESQCLDLNGDFNLDFKACDSKGGKLVWSGECDVGNGGSSPPSPCGDYSIEVAGVSGFDCASTYNGMFLMRSRLEDVFDDHGCVWSSQHNGPIVECADISCDCIDHPDGVPWEFYQTAFVPRMLAMNLGLCTAAGSYLNSKPAIYSRPGGRLPAPPPATITFTLETVNCGTGWPATITATLLPGDDTTGPDKNDRLRSKWNLDYDIEAQLWTLRSFDRIDYPVYTLSDASPCDGETKTLLLSDKGSSADGCGVTPAEVTITRVCPPDRVGKSALLEDRKPNGATGKRKRQCGCDCLDEVDDRRHTCETKCTSAATEGCERIDPAPDDITCRYPEAINCCANTAGKDVPCAYTVEFECDLFFDIDSVRHKIAAKQVTLRRECYFEDPCLFVAPGAESSTGGSPVMDVDGFPGAQPVCSSCADLCLTGCTWDAWTVADCPGDPLPCGPNICDTSATFTMDIAATTGVGDAPCTSAHSVTLVHTGTTDDRWTIDGLPFPATPPPAGQIEIAMTLRERCVTIALYRTADCGSFGPVSAAYSGTPESGECPATFVFTRDFGSSSAFPSTLTAVKI